MASSERLIVGTFTDGLNDMGGQPAGIVVCAYRDGIVGPAILLHHSRYPSWLTISSGGDRLYAVSESADDEEWAGGSVTAYAVDADSTRLEQLNTCPSGGVEPAHLALDRTERFLLVANYGSGSIAVYRRQADGRIGQLTDLVQHAGSSVHPVRQTEPHPHMICVDPETGDVLVPDLGLDAILTYELGEPGTLSERGSARIPTKPGAGPRHVAFHSDGQHLFLVNELDNTLTALRRHDPYRFEVIETKSTLPSDFNSGSLSAAVRVSHSGRYVFTSNRGYDSIAMFEFDAPAATMRLACVVPTDGRGPRDFCQSPDGRYLVVANQDTHTIVTFAIDELNARLTRVSVTSVRSPVCLQWFTSGPVGSAAGKHS